jgi:hypothetical protein
MIIPGRGQPSKLVYLIVLSQLVGPPPARRIIGLVTVDEISHFCILRRVSPPAILTARPGNFNGRHCRSSNGIGFP